MNLLPLEEKIALLNAPQLHLTNQRVIEERSSYASVNLRDITIIRTAYYSNNLPAIIGAILFAGSLFLVDTSDYALIFGGISFLIGAIMSAMSRSSTLDIHAPGGKISVRINYVKRETIMNFIHRIEAEMERVKNQHPVPLIQEVAS